MYKYIWVGILCICFSCKDDKVDDIGDEGSSEKFLQQTEMGVYQQGNPLFVYQAEKHQWAFATDGMHWRLQTDLQDQYVSCELSELPQIDKQLTVTVKTKGVEGMSDGKFSCRILKLEGGKSWVWVPSSATGYLLRLNE